MRGDMASMGLWHVSQNHLHVYIYSILPTLSLNGIPHLQAQKGAYTSRDLVYFVSSILDALDQLKLHHYHGQNIHTQSSTLVAND